MPPELPLVRDFVTGDGTKLRVEEGAQTGTPTVLMIHGFPDSTRLWRFIWPVIAERFRVIAYDQRGFGASERPAEVADYELGRLVADARELIDDLDVGPVHIVGHDWGANVGWALSAHHPERVRSLTALASGHPAYQRSIGSLEKSWYVFLFQLTVAERMFSENDWALFRQWARDHSEVESWIESLRRPGALSSGMNLYRANYPAENGFALPMRVGSVRVPTMGVFGTDDPYLVRERMEQSARYVESEWRFELIESGHWLPLDAPTETAKLIVDFIGAQEALLAKPGGTGGVSH